MWVKPSSFRKGQIAGPAAKPYRSASGLPEVRWTTRKTLWAMVYLALLAATGPTPAAALDEVVLSNGRRYLGTILSDSPRSIVLSIDGGTVEFPRSAVVSPPYLGPEGIPDSAEASSVVDQLADHPLPSVAVALRRLRDFAWSEEVRQVPVLVTDQGRWQYLPGVSFWAGNFCQLSIYGDPARPAAVEVSLIDPPATAWEEKRMLLEYMLGLAPSLAVDSRFDRLDLKRDSFAVGDLWFSLTSPDSLESPGRWAVLLMHEVSLASSRATLAELQAISESVSDATIDPSRPKSWQRASWSPEDIARMRRYSGPGSGAEKNLAPPRNQAWTALGGERVFVRSFVRDRGKYARSTTDWLREVAALVGP